VERHNGWIKAQGVVDGGATFTFHIPLKNGDESNG
jgi:signal transduction histidine kinase